MMSIAKTDEDMESLDLGQKVVRESPKLLQKPLLWFTVLHVLNVMSFMSSLALKALAVRLKPPPMKTVDEVSMLLIDSIDSLDMVSRLQAHELIQIYTNTAYCLLAFCTWILTASTSTSTRRATTCACTICPGELTAPSATIDRSAQSLTNVCRFLHLDPNH
jgi:hypothetical protein